MGKAKHFKAPKLAIVPLKPAVGSQEDLAAKALEGITKLRHDAFEAGFKAGFERGFEQGAKTALGLSPTAKVVDPKKEANGTA